MLTNRLGLRGRAGLFSIDGLGRKAPYGVSGDELYALGTDCACRQGRRLPADGRRNRPRRRHSRERAGHAFDPTVAHLMARAAPDVALDGGTSAWAETTLEPAQA
jgi:hypothetical protein